jgi:hypothetical protein
MSETITAYRRPVQPPAVPSDEVERLSAGTSVPKAPVGPESAKREPMADLLDKFDKIANVLGAKDAGISAGLKRLVEQAAEPGRTEQPLFRTQVAYMLQDVEKLAGTKITSVPAELRTELTKLAGSSPGLENRQMEALLRGTADVADRGVIRDIRRNAATIAGLGDQQSSQAQEIVEVLENRLRLAARFSDAATLSPSSGSTSSNTPDASATASRPGAVLDSPGSERVRTSQSPGDSSSILGDLKPSRMASQADAASGTGAPPQVVSPPKSLLSSIMSNMRAPSGQTPPWEPPPTAMKARVSGFEQKLAEGRTDQHIRAAEKSGQALMQSMETLMNGPGAGVLGKIEAAASTEPGGRRAVMSEMQPGGRYASLRSEFDNALQQDRAFAASFNAVEKAAAQYGHDRLTLGADFQARKMDASQLEARFDRADAAIVGAAEKIPGRSPGQSIMAEMVETMAELLNKAADRVRQIFSREPEAGPKQGSSPGMAP